MTSLDELPRLSEAEFQSQVLELAGLLGYETLHLRGAWTAKGYRVPVQGTLGKGWPDLVLLRARDRRLIFVELKADGAKTTPEQDTVLGLLGTLATTDHGPLVPQIEVWVWKPSAWDGIVKALT